MEVYRPKSETERFAMMLYKLEYWHKLWPYESRPEWLKTKYPDIQLDDEDCDEGRLDAL